MTHDEIRKEIDRLNHEMEIFVEVTIPEMLGCENVRVTIEQWFAAQKILNDSGEKEKRIEFLENARREGHNVKINMQTYKLLLNREPVYSFAIFCADRKGAIKSTWIGQRTTTMGEINAELKRISENNPDKIFYYKRLWGADQ